MRRNNSILPGGLTNKPVNIRLYGLAPDSIVDGVGLRYAVFTQGCPHGCPGCHNPESQPLQGGYQKSVEELAQEIAANKLICGVTLTGGEPLLQSESCLELALLLRKEGLNLWLYTGFLYEDIMQGCAGQAAKDLLDLCDVLVDGLFVEDKHVYDLKWKGSTNQRIIDLVKTRETKTLSLWKIPKDQKSYPSSW